MALIDWLNWPVDNEQVKGMKFVEAEIADGVASPVNGAAQIMVAPQSGHGRTVLTKGLDFIDATIGEGERGEDADHDAKPAAGLVAGYVRDLVSSGMSAAQTDLPTFGPIPENHSPVEQVG